MRQGSEVHTCRGAKTLWKFLLEKSLNTRISSHLRRDFNKIPSHLQIWQNILFFSSSLYCFNWVPFNLSFTHLVVFFKLSLFYLQMRIFFSLTWCFTFKGIPFSFYVVSAFYLLCVVSLNYTENTGFLFRVLFGDII